MPLFSLKQWHKIKKSLYPYRAPFGLQAFLTTRTHDFQGTTGVEHFNQFVKLGDSLAVSTLLLKHPLIQKKIQRREKIDIHDVGGADGTMLSVLLRLLNLSATVSVNEPNQTRLEKYKEKRTQYPHLFFSIRSSNQKVEDNLFIIPPQKELILASHVLYYNRESWLHCHGLTDHLFTKLLKSLCTKGILCILLQHAPPEKSASHEAWEDFIYPLLEGVKHGHNPSFASSDLLDTALINYKKQFIYETNCAIDWVIQTTVAETSVPLGEINTVPDKHGHYKQTEDVLTILQFYLKGRSFDTFSTTLQKTIIDFLVDHFKKRGQYEITHYNKIYTITPGPTLFSKLTALPPTPSSCNPHSSSLS